MGRRGPPSGAEQTLVVHIGKPPPPEPPAELSEAQAAIWRETLTSIPADWIERGGLPVLAEYCRRVVRSRLLESEISRFQPEWLRADGGVERLDRLLDTPRSAVELRTETRVTRQRIDQVLSRLIERGLVTRHEVSGERGLYIYVRSDVKNRDLLLTRPPNLSEGRARALSTLPPEIICQVTAVSKLTGLPQGLLTNWFEQFSAQGLVSTFKLGRRYVGLALRGFQHPQYDPSTPKAPAANLIEDFGYRRLLFIQALDVFGEARTIDLTCALPEDLFDGVKYSSGRLIQGLTLSKLIERINVQPNTAPRYRLTSKGKFAAAILNRQQPPPSADALRARMERRHGIRSARFRDIGRKSFVGGLAPRHDAAVKVLREHGPSTFDEINRRMEIKYNDPRSLNLTLRELEKRGMVRRVKDRNGQIVRTSKRAHLWECVPTPNDGTTSQRGEN
jgi:DNA-binding HxlR family transcriptional regulator